MKVLMIFLLSVILSGCTSVEEREAREAERARKAAELAYLKDQYAELKEKCERKDTVIEGLVKLYAGSLFNKPKVAQEGAAKIGGGVMSSKDCFYAEKSLRKKIKRKEEEIAYF